MFTTIIRPRVSETDGVGHINNTTIPIWFEAGREEIFRILTPDLSFTNWRAVIVNMNVDYVKEVFYGADVEIRTWISKVGNSSFVVEEELFQQGALCAKGISTYVNFNQALHKAETIPAEVRQQFEKHMR
ncbi:thioesterase family protein [Aneurinibacillus sp. Ricciae_BoGa-3]|uniref:acyl-CoA thioesterase n=1 Tax=Aneurinibacillus sp. Ricciae_BoGa-3 TaxID=3022697 RepID=UPI0023410F59|nr:thioesterase family protein [Aneurinibacillus sp. Ricciae_BoGa-3]WCK54911.1 thioesterase family protein [Aneurinibacillus sp. Ricciae_BoGa-3]